MEQVGLERWEGKATAKLPTASAEEAWSLLSPFCSLHLWHPSIHTCRLVAGAEGRPGCVRYCAADAADGANRLFWANEELLDFDAAARSYSYRVTENNMGFERYVAALKVLPRARLDDDDDEDEEGCELEWSFESDPLQQWSREGFVAYLRTAVEAMAKKVEEAAAVAPFGNGDGHRRKLMMKD